MKNVARKYTAVSLSVLLSLVGVLGLPGNLSTATTLEISNSESNPNSENQSGEDKDQESADSTENQVIVGETDEGPIGGNPTSDHDDGMTPPGLKIDDRDNFSSDSNGPIQTKIVGGSNQAISGAPWQVALIDVGGGTNYLGQFCGGTIISSYWIVTAAHCVDDVSVTNLRVLAGSATLGSGMSPLTVDEIILHPRFRSSSFRNDIALVRVSNPFSFSGTVQPLALPARKPSGGTQARITGWGGTWLVSPGGYVDNYYNTPAFYPDHLQGATVTVQADNRCRSEYGTVFNSSEMLCASVPGWWVDTCYGDSGGPLVTGSGSSRVLSGVTSFGAGCAWLHSGVYTNVAHYTSWIRTNAILPGIQTSFSAPSGTATGFTVNVTNYNRAYSYRATVVGGSGRVSVGRASGSTLPLTVTGLTPGASATVQVTATRSGYSSTTVRVEGTANAIPTAQFSSPVSTTTGFTVNVTNYNRAYTYRVTIVGGSGRVSVGRASGSILPLTVTRVAPGTEVTLNLATTISRNTRNDTVTGSAR
jgi:secreted trypsin-like serine protease